MCAKNDKRCNESTRGAMGRGTRSSQTQTQTQSQSQSQSQSQTRSSRRAAPRPSPPSPKAKRALALDPPCSPPLDLDISFKDISDVLGGLDGLFLFSDDELEAEVHRRTALRSTAAPPRHTERPGRVVHPPVDLRCDEILDDPRTDAVTTQPRATPVIKYDFGRHKSLSFAFEVEAVMTERVWVRAPHSRWNDCKITEFIPKNKAMVSACRKARKSISPFYLSTQRGALTQFPSVIVLTP